MYILDFKKHLNRILYLSYIQNKMKAEDNINIKALKDRLANISAASTPPQPEAGGQAFKVVKKGYFITGIKGFSYRQKPQDKPVLNRLVFTFKSFDDFSTFNEQVGTKFQTGQQQGCGSFNIDYTKGWVQTIQFTYDQLGLVQVYLSDPLKKNAGFIGCKSNGKLRVNSYQMSGYLTASTGEIKKGGKGLSSLRFYAKVIPQFNPETVSDPFIKAPTHKTELTSLNKGKGEAFDETRQGFYISNIQGIATPHPDRTTLSFCGLQIYLKSPYDIQKKSKVIGEFLKHTSGLQQIHKEQITLDYQKCFVQYVRLGYDSKSLASIQVFTTDGRCQKMEHSGQKIIRYEEHIINGVLVGLFGTCKPGILSMGLKYKKFCEIK